MADDASISSKKSVSSFVDNASVKMTNPAVSLPTREQVQIMKLRKDNNKYKSLLKMAKERIQAQEEEIESVQSKLSALKEGQEAALSAPTDGKTQSENGVHEEMDCILKICQRIKVEDASNSSDTSESNAQIWALVEYETNPDAVNTPYRRYKKWATFTSESELSDFIRRDTGEPLVLPPYSLTPTQSESVQKKSQEAVSQITEEFRRFRVKAEVARKQADATVKALHNNNVVTTTAKIHGQDLENELQQARTDHAQLAALQRELAEQEAHWREAYDTLLAENTALKSSGAEALLAAQWRQRYEACQSEKEDLETKFQMVKSQVDILKDQNKVKDAGKYEVKYRDLKESFRLYRKKAKEIFEAQQSGNTQLLTANDKGLEDAKMLYLRNLMVNYLSSDPAVRDHMEGAIGTVLKFSDDEMIRIEKKREEEQESWQESWFKKK